MIEGGDGAVDVDGDQAGGVDVHGDVVGAAGAVDIELAAGERGGEEAAGFEGLEEGLDVPILHVRSKDNGRMRSLGAIDRLDWALNCRKIWRQMELGARAEAEFGGGGEDHLPQPEGGLEGGGLGAELWEEGIVRKGGFGEPQGEAGILQ